MCNTSCELGFILLFLFFFRLFKFTMRKSRLNTIYASDSIQQDINCYFGSWKNIIPTIRLIYVKTFILKEANKL